MDSCHSGPERSPGCAALLPCPLKEQEAFIERNFYPFFPARSDAMFASTGMAPPMAWGDGADRPVDFWWKHLHEKRTRQDLGVALPLLALVELSSTNRPSDSPVRRVWFSWKQLPRKRILIRIALVELSSTQRPIGRPDGHFDFSWKQIHGKQKWDISPRTLIHPPFTPINSPWPSIHFPFPFIPLPVSTIPFSSQLRFPTSKPNSFSPSLNPFTTDYFRIPLNPASISHRPH